MQIAEDKEYIFLLCVYQLNFFCSFQHGREGALSLPFKIVREMGRVIAVITEAGNS